ncbi:hypothetical protein EDD85DRAFT_792935 [Armillaria nabsnona]|nr:hypothetical protein EDD85DRAFT_792935 [Armillaria nabsnona]
MVNGQMLEAVLTDIGQHPIAPPIRIQEWRRTVWIDLSSRTFEARDKVNGTGKDGYCLDATFHHSQRRHPWRIFWDSRAARRFILAVQPRPTKLLHLTGDKNCDTLLNILGGTGVSLHSLKNIVLESATVDRVLSPSDAEFLCEALKLRIDIGSANLWLEELLLSAIEQCYIILPQVLSSCAHELLWSHTQNVLVYRETGGLDTLICPILSSSSLASSVESDDPITPENHSVHIDVEVPDMEEGEGIGEVDVA